MSREITAEERRANIAHWKFQDRLMLEQGFKLCRRMQASWKPKAYVTADYMWQISTTTKGRWKLERFRCEMLVQGAGRVRVYSPCWRPLFDTPLAVALWFNMMKRTGVLK